MKVSAVFRLKVSYLMMDHYILEKIPSGMELQDKLGTIYGVYHHNLPRHLQNVDPYYFYFFKKKLSNFRYYNFRLSPSEVLLEYSVMFIFKFYIQIICV